MRLLFIAVLLIDLLACGTSEPLFVMHDPRFVHPLVPPPPKLCRADVDGSAETGSFLDGSFIVDCTLDGGSD
jgi:hypothetical protein